MLRRETITARILHVVSITAGEFAENEFRKDCTASERVAIGEVLETELGDRQGQRTDVELRRNCAKVEPGTRTEDIAARKAGFGNRKTDEQAKKVVEKAVDEVISQMDSEHIAVSTAAVVADEPPERQREIAAMPPTEQREAGHGSCQRGFRIQRRAGSLRKAGQDS